MVNSKAYNILLENRFKNQFLKREVVLFGFAITAIIILLFVFNNWVNIISAVLILIAILLVSLKLFSLFDSREKKYADLIQKHVIEFELQKKEKSKNDSLQEIASKKENNNNEIDKTIAYKNQENPIKDSFIDLIFDLPLLKDSKNDVSTQSSASPLLKKRAKERKKKMKDFNYKFALDGKQKNYRDYLLFHDYFLFIENEYNKKAIKKSEYKLLTNLMLDYLTTEAVSDS